MRGARERKREMMERRKDSEKVSIAFARSDRLARTEMKGARRRERFREHNCGGADERRRHYLPMCRMKCPVKIQTECNNRVDSSSSLSSPGSRKRAQRKRRLRRADVRAEYKYDTQVTPALPGQIRDATFLGKTRSRASRGAINANGRRRA